MHNTCVDQLVDNLILEIFDIFRIDEMTRENIVVINNNQWLLNFL